MGDRERRELQRRAASGDPEARAAFARAEQRGGDVFTVIAVDPKTGVVLNEHLRWAVGSDPRFERRFSCSESARAEVIELQREHPDLEFSILGLGEVFRPSRPGELNCSPGPGRAAPIQLLFRLTDRLLGFRSGGPEQET